MYPKARQCQALNFNARLMALDYLASFVKLSFFEDASLDAKWRHYAYTEIDVQEMGAKIEIRLNFAAHLVWPLFEPRYTKAERDASSFLFASTVNHPPCQTSEVVLRD